MNEICDLWSNGACGAFDEDDPDEAPCNCDEEGLCIDEYDITCDEFTPSDVDLCDYCGEPLGFCAIDCESLDDDFEM